MEINIELETCNMEVLEGLLKVLREQGVKFQISIKEWKS